MTHQYSSTRGLRFQFLSIILQQKEPGPINGSTQPLLGVFIFLQGFPHSSVGKSSACNVGDVGSIPGSGRSSGAGNGNPLQYSCRKNLMAGYSPSSFGGSLVHVKNLPFGGACTTLGILVLLSGTDVLPTPSVKAWSLNMDLQGIPSGFLKKNFFNVLNQLIYNLVLISGVQLRLFSIIRY